MDDGVLGVRASCRCCGITVPLYPFEFLGILCRGCGNDHRAGTHQMILKDPSVQAGIHHILMRFLLEFVDPWYIDHGDQLILTSGSEPSAVHSYGSKHYGRPGEAADIRTWDEVTHGRGHVPTPYKQWKALGNLAVTFCKANGLPLNCIDVVLEKTHIHIELHFKGRD